MNKRIFTSLSVAALLAMPLISLAQIGVAEGSSWNSGGTICTQDAMQCPDGSWVGRSGPNCEFICGSTPPPVDPYPGYYEAPYPGTPGNSGFSGGMPGGYIDWAPMWWNPFAESGWGEPGGYYYGGPAIEEPPFWNPLTPPQGTMCTQDAMQCPDGSWVGRSGPNCEFVCGGYNEAPYPVQPMPSTNWLGGFFSNFFNWLGF